LYIVDELTPTPWLIDFQPAFSPNTGYYKLDVPSWYNQFHWKVKFNTTGSVSYQIDNGAFQSIASEQQQYYSVPQGVTHTFTLKSTVDGIYKIFVTRPSYGKDTETRTAASSAAQRLRTRCKVKRSGGALEL
jgi:hypothetical protein